MIVRKGIMVMENTKIGNHFIYISVKLYLKTVRKDLRKSSTRKVNSELFTMHLLTGLER